MLLLKKRGADLVREPHQVKLPALRRSKACWSKLVLFPRGIHPTIGRFFQCVHERRMDRTDLKILAILQEDASLPVAEIAARVNLSQTPCWRRIQRLEQQGVIERRVAILNPESVGLGLSVFVEIEAVDHSPEWLES